MATTLWHRDTSLITNVLVPRQSSPSSWDRCMAHTYCKWPVIAGCIAVGLILLSLLVCLVGCVCCGLSCCCGCCRCCSRRPSRPPPSANSRQAYPAPAYGGYQPSPSQPPPYQPQPAPYYPQPVAHFDTPRGTVIKGPFNEDALPPMPSWDAAPARRVPVETGPQQQDIELGHLSAPMGQDERAYTDTSQANSYGGPAHNFDDDIYRASSGYQRVEQDYFQARSVASPVSPNSGVGFSTPVQRTPGHPGELSPIHTTPSFTHYNNETYDVSPITPYRTYPSKRMEYSHVRVPEQGPPR